MARIIAASRELQLLLLTLLLGLLAACTPYLADQQSARLLAPGEAEVTPSFSYVSFSAEGQTEHVQDHLGVRIGYGASEGVELRGTYERVSIQDAEEGVNVFGVGAKFAVVPDQVAFYLPIGFVTGAGVTSSDTWTVAPTLMATARPEPNVEITPSLKAIYPFAAQNPELYLGFGLGAGISTDLEEWAFRPEVGLVVNPGESGVTWGWTLGFSIRP